MIRYKIAWLGLFLNLTTTACATVDTIRLTGETFPPKSSVDEVAVLDQEPAASHIQLAELSIADSGSGMLISFESMQRKILKKAAALGADAVVFSKPESSVSREVAYEPAYSPWGYYGPYYGPGSWGYGGPGYSSWGYGNPYGPWGWGGYGSSVAVPYDVTTNWLKGIAIKYTEPAENKAKSDSASTPP